ncbi:class I adenylate-forming enzyme family protein [Brevibacterium sp. VCM10]|uniref:class I adenylate-forming enzyme family protein n=1 Tax=Brevibacterium sp. VCM10 TaxID=1381751 RepID=UPI000470DD25|nr:AMP-binding protein [Brevibacterium sp. VCM10]
MATTAYSNSRPEAALDPTTEAAQTFSVAEVVGLPFTRAHSDPTGPCLSWPEGRLDNSEFAAAVAATAQTLRDRHGITSGSVVGVLLRNVPELITTMFATWSLGAALTPINPALTDEEVLFQLDDSGAKALVGEERADTLSFELGLGHLSVTDECFRAEPGADLADAPDGSAVRDDDAGLIVYTSGTTGRPKGCVLEQSNLAAMVWSILNGLDFGDDVRSLLVLPLFHCNGLLAGTVTPLMLGGSVHVLPKFEGRTFWDVVEEERPTYFSAVPTIFSVLEAQTTREVDTSSLRFVICGAAPMSKDAIARFETKFDVDMVEGYGLSECSVCATLNRNDGTAKPGTVGPALPGFEVGIKDPDGNLLPAGEAGEVVIASRTIMRGYLGRPDATAEVLRDGWLHTGDVGFLDDDGYLTLVDRIKDLIIRGGENIYPKEIEDALLGHDQVVEAAVVGDPDEKYGELVVAHITLREGATTTESELLSFLEPRLARYKLPTTIHIRDGLPKNSVGKIVKGELRAS